MLQINQQEVLESIRREKENLTWITKSMAALREHYGDRYIAVKDQKVIDSDASFEALLARVRKLEHPEAVTIEQITAAEYLWML